MSQQTSKNILFQITGSIAAYKACGVISQLVQQGHQVQVVTSSGARQFIGDATLEGLTGRPVATDIFATGEMMGHIDWARWADVFVLCPATANTLNRLANGLSDDLIGSVFLAQNFSKPYLIFPAMNSSMLVHPATRSSLETLEHWGAQVFPTDTGILACGDVGAGKLLDPEVILGEILKATQGETREIVMEAGFVPQRILITAGGTREPIDGVRFLTNFSTGRTGVYLAERLAERGHQVTLLKSGLSPLTHSSAGLTSRTFDSFADLKSQMADLLKSKSFDVILQAAAVSDFSVDHVENPDGTVVKTSGKIPSGHDVNIKLVPNPKLISMVRDWSTNKEIKVVGFKLTNTKSEDARQAAVRRLLSQSGPDYVVANDLGEISDHQHPFQVYNPSSLVGSGKTKSEMASFLIRLIEEGSSFVSPSRREPGPEVTL
ncbi:MAG: bifunctional phosphopantothenoylcysteine decarboxylase/phosphopantothenate--cysteine ligase CoaBC [Bdellovibrionaceae bacterium]|nr:bifunctional phosphopantothenoylcysteine decarboxylase/phosphopantothenate--cysteine ligase CoaBC [Bdellovibrionales bacterium]MCB9086301.1 bifunctional phosphopantothenoylcysteine decarboxylase/phosphopantothenate--cysteine ligase CoaBC [Pseudobdellovibrionaceae bacterium]